MTTRNLLVELFVEELPPKALRKLGDVFANVLFENLKSQGLVDAGAALTSFASPRRLAAHVTNVSSQAVDKSVSQKLMPVAVGLDSSGQPTPALIKKLASLGAGPEAAATLTRQGEGKAEALFYESVVSGAMLAAGLQKALEEALSKLPIPKVMTYQLSDGWTDVKFVRPAHGLVALHGSDVVDISVLGLKSQRNTHGHRFEAKVDPVVLANADEYESKLRGDGAVIASFAARRADMESQLAAAAKKSGGDVSPIDDDALLDEVTALVERPNVLTCEFDKEFLDVPQECLILTMKANQKYFPLLQSDGKLTNKFLVVSNISPDDASAVIGGNERVVRPRLADAKFFFDQDRKKTLESRTDQLEKMVYHNKLGTQGERVKRVRAIASSIGQALGGATLAQQADQAAHLAKADLLTDMVGEFPELQGIMGRYYALNDGLSTDIADAIEDHYKPRFAGDGLPRGQVGVAVALADKLETLVGMFGIGNLPTGDKDPFALRRHALGVIRMLSEQNLPLDISALANDAYAAFGDRLPADRAPAIDALLTFIYERLSGSLRDQGYSPQEVDAVVSQRPGRLGDIAKRLAAVKAFALLPEAPALAAANKRVSNILKKADGVVSPAVNVSLLTDDAEKALHSSLLSVSSKADDALEAGNYTGNLQALAELKSPVDAFFENVMVNAEDPALRANRLGLLASLHESMNRVADLSRLAS